MANPKFSNKKKNINSKFVDSNSLAKRISIPNNNSSFSKIQKRKIPKNEFNYKKDLSNRIGNNNQSVSVGSYFGNNSDNNKQHGKTKRSQLLNQRAGNNLNLSKTLIKSHSKNSNNMDDKTYVKSEPAKENSKNELYLRPLPIFFYLENLHPETTKQEVINILEKYITKVKYVKMKSVKTNGWPSLSIEAVFKTIVPSDIDRTNFENSNQNNSIAVSTKNTNKCTTYMLQLITEAVETFDGVEADGKVLSCGYLYGVSKLINTEEWDIIKETF